MICIILSVIHKSEFLLSEPHSAILRFSAVARYPAYQPSCEALLLIVRPFHSLLNLRFRRDQKIDIARSGCHLLLGQMFRCSYFFNSVICIFPSSPWCNNRMRLSRKKRNICTFPANQKRTGNLPSVCFARLPSYFSGYFAVSVSTIARAFGIAASPSFTMSAIASAI